MRLAKVGDPPSVPALEHLVRLESLRGRIALEQRGVVAAARERQRRGKTREPTAQHDDVHRVSVSWREPWPMSPP